MFSDVHRRGREGIALLLTLFMIVLAAVLVVAFLVNSRTELQSSSTYAAGLEAESLSTTAVNLVVHQIRSGAEGKTPDGFRYLWASQPGMIQTWDDKGKFYRAFKLYSDETMVEAAHEALSKDAKELKEWDSDQNRGIYVDLNAPVLRGEKVFYPIVDPRAKDEDHGKAPPKKGSDQSSSDQGGEASTEDMTVEERRREVNRRREEERLRRLAEYYRGMGRSVEGFDFDLEEVGFGPTGKGLPMPVKWIYQLEDGTLGTLNAERRFQPLDTEADSIPARDNPIVARIAFWADDETAKININTASEPTPWDTPKTVSPKDRSYGKFQPSAFEYQRYPGHPATTAISPVLMPYQELRRRHDYGQSTTLHHANREWSEEKEEIYALTPRISGGGSKGGLVSVARLKYDKEADKVELDRDRLYATVDEFLLKPDRQMNEFPKRWEDVPKKIEQSRFFLTCQSRAPEVNLFNMPRISIWPTHEKRESARVNSGEEQPAGENSSESGRDENSEGESGESENEDDKSEDTIVHRTAFDEAIRFCATMGPLPPSELDGDMDTGDLERYFYHFQRRDSNSPTIDFEEIERNQQLYDYLKWMVNHRLPGYGESLKDKYQEDSEQILTEIVDYIRCTNLYDDNLTPLYYSKEDWLAGVQAQFTDGRRELDKLRRGKVIDEYDSATYIWPGHGQVTPLQLEENDTMGFGRFYTLSEAGFIFICNADAGTNPNQPKGILNSNDPQLNRALEEPLELGQKSIQAMFVMELFSPSLGWTQLHDDFSINVRFEDPVRVDGTDLQFGNGDWVQSADFAIGTAPNLAKWGGTAGFWGLTKARRAPERLPMPKDAGYEGRDEKTAHGLSVYKRSDPN